MARKLPQPKVVTMVTDAALEHFDAARGVRFVPVGRAEKPRMVERQVASTLEEAQEAAKKGKVMDYFDPVLGWIRRGKKVERDYPENEGELYEPTPGVEG
ncbi:MAG: hypothetical protein C4521_01815 [Actinobacteria bacterium]|nr:MAG: hypothetical protein C4521_01815 [Actinomycetota bacterium]